MGFQVGDAVFNRDGKVGFVKQQRPMEGDAIISNDKDSLKKIHQFGYVNGLNPDLRNRFNDIMKEVYDLKVPSERITHLSELIAKQREDPRNHILVKYLNSELSHLMYSEGIQPRTYTRDE